MRLQLAIRFKIDILILPFNLRQIVQGVQVANFIEMPESASVEAGGVIYTADVVIGADGGFPHKTVRYNLTFHLLGVKSKARELVLGVADAPKPSGYAIFRTSYSADLIRVGSHLVFPIISYLTSWIDRQTQPAPISLLWAKTLAPSGSARTRTSSMGPPSAASTSTGCSPSRSH